MDGIEVLYKSGITCILAETMKTVAWYATVFAVAAKVHDNMMLNYSFGEIWLVGKSLSFIFHIHPCDFPRVGGDLLRIWMVGPDDKP